MLVIPGGNVEPTSGDPGVIAWIRNGRRRRVVLSVCNGAFILAKTGLLDGLEATTFAELIDEPRRPRRRCGSSPTSGTSTTARSITTAGLSSGIDGSLHVVEKLLGRGRAQMIATNMEYDWDPEGRYVRAALADKHLRTAYDALRQTERKPLSHAGDRERWETRWLVTTDLPAADFAARLGRDLEQGAGCAARPPMPGRSPGQPPGKPPGRSRTPRAAPGPARRRSSPPGRRGRELLVSVRVARAAATAANAAK